MLRGVPKITKEKIGDEVMTRAKMDPIVKDLKEFITSTVKRSENALREDVNVIKSDLVQVKMTVQGHSNAIMELSREVRGLKSDVSGLKSDVKHLDKKIDGVRTELKEDIHQTETRLSEKIDKIGDRFDDHEIRITNLETAHP